MVFGGMGFFIMLRSVWCIYRSGFGVTLNKKGLRRPYPRSQAEVSISYTVCSLSCYHHTGTETVQC